VGHSVFGRQKMERIVKGRGGACAEWCVVEALDVVAKPSNITHEHAAAGKSQNRCMKETCVHEKRLTE